MEIATNIYIHLVVSQSLKYVNQHFAQATIFPAIFLINLHRVNQFYYVVSHYDMGKH